MVRPGSTQLRSTLVMVAPWSWAHSHLPLTPGRIWISGREAVSTTGIALSIKHFVEPCDGFFRAAPVVPHPAGHGQEVGAGRDHRLAVLDRDAADRHAWHLHQPAPPFDDL